MAASTSAVSYVSIDNSEKGGMYRDLGEKLCGVCVLLCTIWSHVSLVLTHVSFSFYGLPRVWWCYNLAMESKVLRRVSIMQDATKKNNVLTFMFLDFSKNNMDLQWSTFLSHTCRYLKERQH